MLFVWNLFRAMRFMREQLFRTDHRYQFCQLNVLNHLLRPEMICKFHLNVRIQLEYLLLVQIHDYRDQLLKMLDEDLYEEKESI